MSRQNKVNPGMYTQRGRLTQDDAARELAKQRATGSEHTWQPVQSDQQPRPASRTEDTDDDDVADDEPVATPKKPARVTAKAKPAPKAKAKAPRVARKAVLARGAGKGSTLLKAGQKKKQPAKAKRKG